MFRCCLPCRGGSTAPATSPPSSPESSDENYTNLYHSDSVRNEQPQGNNSVLNSSSPSSNATGTSPSSTSSSTSTGATSSTRTYHDTSQQQTGLPHIEEEEELDQNHHTASGDCNNLKEHLINTKRSIRIVNQVQLQQHQQQQREKAAAQQARRSSSAGLSAVSAVSGSSASSTGGAPAATGDEINLSNSPSPRSKHSRKAKRTKSVTPATASETPSGSVLESNIVSAIANPSSGYLFPKMQAEQGSIGELQKYHGRYLKNRRHTLANVR